MIFLSHTRKDKPIVEQFAIRLRQAFGQDKVFYDSWSIQPGDGIIDKMNEGLKQCQLFLFFVSKNSLQSKMVELEWQNAVIKATKGKTKIIPVKLDDCLMPPILLQTLYIDLFGQGLEVALRQVLDVVSGESTFAPGPQQFSNLRAYTYADGKKRTVECHAEFYMEPISHFLFLVNNAKDELSFSCKSSAMVRTRFNKNIKLNDGKTYNAQMMAVERSTVPGFPFVVEITPKLDGISIELTGVMHEKQQNQWEMIPLNEGKKNA